MCGVCVFVCVCMCVCVCVIGTVVDKDLRARLHENSPSLAPEESETSERPVNDCHFSKDALLTIKFD